MSRVATASTPVRPAEEPFGQDPPKPEPTATADGAAEGGERVEGTATLDTGDETYRPPPSDAAADAVGSPRRMEALRAELLMLQEERRECVREGDFLEAQRVLDDIRRLHVRREEERLLAVRAEQLAEHEQDAMVLKARHEEQLERFTELWDQRLSEFDEHAQEAQEQMRKKHERDYAEQEDVWRSQATAQRPHYSARAVNLRRELEAIVASANYTHAHAVQKQLRAAEGVEDQQFEADLAVRVAHKARRLRTQQSQELAALGQRIESEREQLEAQRRIDFQTLLQRHSNDRETTEARTRRRFAGRARGAQQRLVMAISSPPDAIARMSAAPVKASPRHTVPRPPTTTPRTRQHRHYASTSRPSPYQ